MSSKLLFAPYCRGSASWRRNQCSLLCTEEVPKLCFGQFVGHAPVCKIVVSLKRCLEVGLSTRVQSSYLAHPTPGALIRTQAPLAQQKYQNYTTFGGICAVETRKLVVPWAAPACQREQGPQVVHGAPKESCIRERKPTALEICPIHTWPCFRKQESLKSSYTFTDENKTTDIHSFSPVDYLL